MNHQKNLVGKTLSKSYTFLISPGPNFKKMPKQNEGNSNTEQVVIMVVRRQRIFLNKKSAKKTRFHFKQSNHHYSFRQADNQYQ